MWCEDNLAPLLTGLNRLRLGLRQDRRPDDHAAGRKRRPPFGDRSSPLICAICLSGNKSRLAFLSSTPQVVRRQGQRAVSGQAGDAEVRPVANLPGDAERGYRENIPRYKIASRACRRRCHRRPSGIEDYQGMAKLPEPKNTGKDNLK